MSLNVRRRGIASATCLHDWWRIARELLRLDHRGLDAVQREEVRHLFRVVDDVVERGGEGVDVLAVDRRDERLVEALDDVVRDPVALVLAVHQSRPSSPWSGHASSMSSSRRGRADDVRAGLLEEVEELSLPRREETAQLRHGRESVVVNAAARPAAAPSSGPPVAAAPRGRCRTCAPAPGSGGCGRPPRSRRGRAPSRRAGRRSA